MRCFSLSVWRALVCLFMAILRVHALVVIPSAASPQTHPPLRAQDADGAPPASERGPPAWDWDSDWVRAPSHSPGPHPAPSLPTVTRVLPSHAPWYTQLPPEDATSLGHAPATFPKQGTESSQRVLDGSDDNAVAWQQSSPREQFASWILSRASDRDSGSDHPRRRRRPSRPDDAGRSDYKTSEDTKVSVLAVAVVGVVLGCHYLDYL